MANWVRSISSPERRRRDRERMRETVGLEIGEPVRAETAELEPRAARGNGHAFAALGLEPDLGTVGQLPDDLVKRMGRNGGGARGAGHGRRGLGHLDIEVGRPEVQPGIRRRHQHIGQNWIGIAPLDDAMDMAKRFQQMVAFERYFHFHYSLCDQPGITRRPRTKAGFGMWQASTKNASACRPVCACFQGEVAKAPS